MRCHVTLDRQGSQFVARCAEYPSCSGEGGTREEALERLRASVLFWLEACPCDVHAGEGLQLEIVREPY